MPSPSILNIDSGTVDVYDDWKDLSFDLMSIYVYICPCIEQQLFSLMNLCMCCFLKEIAVVYERL